MSFSDFGIGKTEYSGCQNGTVFGSRHPGRDSGNRNPGRHLGHRQDRIDAAQAGRDRHADDRQSSMPGDHAGESGRHARHAYDDSIPVVDRRAGQRGRFFGVAMSRGDLDIESDFEPGQQIAGGIGVLLIRGRSDNDKHLLLHSLLERLPGDIVAKMRSLKLNLVNGGIRRLLRRFDVAADGGDTQNAPAGCIPGIVVTASTGMK
jgi:hypothetical protein